MKRANGQRRLIITHRHGSHHAFADDRIRAFGHMQQFLSTHATGNRQRILRRQCGQFRHVGQDQTAG